jgi:hypothetical protein
MSLAGGGSGGGAAGVLLVGREEKEWECECCGLMLGKDGLGAVKESKDQQSV